MAEERNVDLNRILVTELLENQPVEERIARCVLETRVEEEFLKMARDHVHFWDFVLPGFNLLVLLTGCWFIEHSLASGISVTYSNVLFIKYVEVTGERNKTLTLAARCLSRYLN